MRRLAVVVVVLAVASEAHAAATAGCSNACLPVAGGAQNSALSHGSVSLSVASGVSLYEPSSREPGDPDQSGTLAEARLGAEFGVARGLGVSMLVPFRVFVSRIEGAGDIHVRDETLSGIGDATVLGRLQRGRGPWSLDVRAGWSVPLADMEEDPHRLGALGAEHQHFQLGTGTVNPVVALALDRSFAGAQVGVWATTQQVLYANGKGFQAGDRYGFGVRASSALGTSRFQFRAGAELQLETAERWHGKVPEDEGNRGRVDFLLSGGTTWQATDRFAIGADVRVPVVQHIEGEQLAYVTIAELSLTWSFGGAGAHAARPAPWQVDWSGADYRSLTDRGELVPLVPVPGQVTVFDFWATWCAPCRELAGRMAEIARAHPGQVAIRALDVTDWNSPAANTVLRAHGFHLPHVKIYGKDGQLAYQGGITPDELSARIASLLAAR